MIKAIIARKLAAFETEWNYSMDYAREILEVGVSPLKKFFDAQKLAEYRGGIPKSGHYAAKILGVMAGDCGPCVQLVVDMALRDKVDPEALASLVAGDFAELPEEMRLCSDFTQALLSRTEELPTLREEMKTRYGTEGLIAIAYAVISAGMFPTLKYALGHGHGCAKVEIGDHRIVPPKAETILYRAV